MRAKIKALLHAVRRSYSRAEQRTAQGAMRATITLTDDIFARTYRLTWRGLMLDHVEVLHAENAARIFRRTMKPWELLSAVNRDGQFEAICFPFVDVDGCVKVIVRSQVGVPGLLLDLPCAQLRPIKFSPRRTGMPCNDPIEAVKS